MTSSPDDQPDLDPDLDVGESASGRTLPLHLTPRALALVFVGGAVGTAARYGVTHSLGPVEEVPVGTLTVNIVGAFVLGLLLERLSRLGSDVGRRSDLRLLVGTGVLGGFTTYSTFALDTQGLLDRGLPSIAVAYALATVAGGFAASILGIALGRRRRR